MIELKTNLSKVQLAINFFYKNLPEILSQIDALPEDKYFTYTTLTNKQIVQKITSSLINDQQIILGHTVNFKMKVNILGYRPFNPWSSVVGYTVHDDDLTNDTIYINLRKLPKMSPEEVAGNILHECLHLINFGHGSNKLTKDKIKSVPYFLGYLMSGEKQIEDLIGE